MPEELQTPIKPSQQKRPLWLSVVMYTFPFAFVILLTWVILTWPETEKGISEYSQEIAHNKTPGENILMQRLEGISVQQSWNKYEELSRNRTNKIQADYYKNHSYLRFVEVRKTFWQKD